MLPKKLQNKLKQREDTNALRSLGVQNDLIDFSSNDYLGFAKSEVIFKETHTLLTSRNIYQNGATGSRLLSGNHALYTETEKMLCEFHNSDAALIFNSGYDANIGLLSSVPQRGDIILYDELIHASIRDGIGMSNAKAYKFKHNNLNDLSNKVSSHQNQKSSVFIVTESVFSMDGDSPDLIAIAEIAKINNIYLIVDEAHAIGVLGDNGVGLVQHLNLQDQVFARLITFGKALGCHGAAILGSSILKQYLVNFARSFIYTTGLSPHSVATIHSVYNALKTDSENREKLYQNIAFFKAELHRLQLQKLFIESNSTIHCCVVSGNENVKSIAKQLQQKGFDVKPIMSPTVSLGQERLRFCLHAYNSQENITSVLKLLATFVASS